MSECGRCHRIIQGKMHFIRGCNIHVCRDCAQEAFEKCQCCGGYFAEEDIIYPETEVAICIWCASERYLICPHCREYIRKDEAVEFHGHLMCENCRDAYFSLCDCCHERFETTALMDAEDEDGDSVNVCPDCLQKKFRHCVECGSLVANYFMFEGKAYCIDCCEECWNCHEKMPGDKLETINTADGYHDVCPDCYALFDQCAFCGYDRPKDKLHKINDEWYCEDCLPKYLAQLKEEERALAMQQLDATLVGTVAGLAIFRGLDLMSKHGCGQSRGLVHEDTNEAQFDDGFPDDYVGDGLDGTDDYLGDGLDGPDDYDDDSE